MNPFRDRTDVQALRGELDRLRVEVASLRAVVNDCGCLNHGVRPTWRAVAATQRQWIDPGNDDERR